MFVVVGLVEWIKRSMVVNSLGLIVSDIIFQLGLNLLVEGLVGTTLP